MRSISRSHLAHGRAGKWSTQGILLADDVARKVMDLAAISLCMESRIPVVVFRLDVEGHLVAAVRGEPVGTIVSAGEDR